MDPLSGQMCQPFPSSHADALLSKRLTSSLLPAECDGHGKLNTSGLCSCAVDDLGQPKYAGSACAYLLLPGWAYSGPNLQTQPQVSCPDANCCADQCAHTEGCKMFTFAEALLQCVLKTESTPANSYLVNDSGSVIGGVAIQGGRELVFVVAQGVCHVLEGRLLTWEL